MSKVLLNSSSCSLPKQHVSPSLFLSSLQMSLFTQKTLGKINHNRIPNGVSQTRLHPPSLTNVALHKDTTEILVKIDYSIFHSNLYHQHGVQCPTWPIILVTHLGWMLNIGAHSNAPSVWSSDTSLYTTYINYTEESMLLWAHHGFSNYCALTCIPSPSRALPLACQVPAFTTLYNTLDLLHLCFLNG